MLKRSPEEQVACPRCDLDDYRDVRIRFAIRRGMPSEDHAKEASELAERGPEAFPD